MPIANCQLLSTLIRTPHLHSSKPRRGRAVSCPHHLLWLSLTAVRSPPEDPLIARADRVHGIPELCRNARVRRVLQHPHPLAVLDLPANLGPELKVVPLIIDGPRSVCLEQNRMIGRGNQLLKGEGLLSCQNADVGHADDRQPVPTFC